MFWRHSSTKLLAPQQRLSSNLALALFCSAQYGFSANLLAQFQCAPASPFGHLYRNLDFGRLLSSGTSYKLLLQPLRRLFSPSATMSGNSSVNPNSPAPGISQLQNSQIIVDAQGIVRVIPRAQTVNVQRQPIQFPPYDALAAATDRNNHFATIPRQPTLDTTSQHPYEHVSEVNLHPLHFQLEPPPDRLQGLNFVPLLYNAATNLVEVAPNRQTPLRHFSFLPRWIERNVPKVLLELWFRLDPRLQPSDIVHRMRLNNVGQAVSTNSLNTKRMRMRELLNVPGWHRSHQFPTAPELAPLNDLSADQLRLNTAMFVDLQNNRLLQPVIQRRRMIGYIDSGLPVDYFIRSADGQLFAAPGPPMTAALVLRHRLQTLALIRDPGNNAPHNYMKLDKKDKPSWWKENKKG